MNNNIIKNATKWILRGIQFQLYLTLMSMPILAYWGLPVSLMSPFGNMLFHPLLTLFLFLSSIVFFCQICHIPNTIVIIALEKTTHLFHYLLGFGSQEWLMGFAKPSLVILIFLPLATMAMLCYKNTKTPIKSIIGLFVLFCLFSVYLKFTCKPIGIVQIPCNKGDLTLANINKQIILIDPGALGQCISAPSWVEFTLAPTIVNLTGRTIIDFVILMQPSQMSFEAIAALCNVTTIKNLYMPFWKGDMSKGQKRAYAKLMQAAKDQQTQIIRIGRTITLPCGPEPLVIEPQEQVIDSQGMTYKALVVTGFVGTKKITCRSLKMDTQKIDQRDQAIKKALTFSAMASQHKKSET